MDNPMNKNWVRIASVEDVPEGGTLPARCQGEPVCLYKLNGKIFATHDTCSHGQASLADGFIVDENIECPLHQGLFHIPTGKAVGVPCTEDIKVYPTRVQDGAVYIAPPSD
jgi:nitrite reductase/ring-hydroxylating ferredoxin subunit